MSIRRIDHIGIVVKDIAAAKAFFLELGLELMGEAIVEGEAAERVIALQKVKSEVVMLKTPDGHGIIELSEFHSPKDENEIQTAFANTLGIRHICFAVEEIEGLVSKLQKHGAELVGGIVNYENSYKLCYIRGPEGMILELAEELRN